MSTELQETHEAEIVTGRSTSIGKLALALSKAQGAMTNAAKAADNPFFHSKYADLASVWDACRAPLSSNELAVIQIPGESTSGRVAVETLLAHSSGEWISSRITLKPVKDDPQGVGSAITYARRYGLQAIAGIASEDDDGNAASGKSGSQGTDKQQKPANKGNESTTIGAANGNGSATTKVEPPTLGAVLDSIDISLLDKKDADFALQMKSAFAQYGANARVSDKQMAWLKRLTKPQIRKNDVADYIPITDDDIPF